MSATPIKGVKVLDLSKVLAGPLCAQYLGDMGADVIKVEAPDGDETRGWPPFRSANDETDATGTVFLSANRNKRSIAVNLRNAEGRAVVHRLAKSVDVVISSFGPGVAERLGVDAATLRELNPRLVYCNISGFGCFDAKSWLHLVPGHLDGALDIKSLVRTAEDLVPLAVSLLALHAAISRVGAATIALQERLAIFAFLCFAVRADRLVV